MPDIRNQAEGESCKEEQALKPDKGGKFKSLKGPPQEKVIDKKPEIHGFSA